MAGIIPTKSNLLSCQKSLKLAKLGYELLEQKKNLLIRELSGFSDKEKELQKETVLAYRRAYKALRLASLTLGRCGTFASCVPLDNSFEFDSKYTMGLKLPVITCTPAEDFCHYGVADTNGYLDEARLLFEKAKQLSVSLAVLQADKTRLNAVISKTAKRSNALSNVRIPQLEAQIKLITEALDEKEREDFSRLKLIKKYD